MLDPKLLAILVCPVTRTPLRHDTIRSELVSDRAGLAYPIENNTPLLLPDRAREVPPRD